ncbi:hypothetical protein CC2G_012468 [Coprinopsis cinerea AmutBmut pab1-1]|nr:hypothetical protein CC2G_012468 [Coprinopsis cinerea AmutBmut pab1-1]
MSSVVASLGLRTGNVTRARILAVPLVRPKLPSPATSSSSPSNSHPQSEHNRNVLTYYQFQLSNSEDGARPEDGALELKEGKRKKRKGWIPRGGVSSWLQAKAAELWAGFGRAEGGWKLKTFQMGERIMDRLDFEELALKSIDPSMGPTVSHPRSNFMQRGEKGLVSFQIPLLYPPSITLPENALEQLRKDVEHRTPIHRKGFYTWMLLAPLTTPFIIVPVIPNLPFFFCVWRSWSHYRAYRSSQYLQSLLDKDLIVPQASQVLDKLYEEYHPSKSPFASETSKEAQQPARISNGSATSSRNGNGEGGGGYEMLLAKEAVPELVRRFELRPDPSGDLYRALEQARMRMEKGKI